MVCDTTGSQSKILTDSSSQNGQIPYEATRSTSPPPELTVTSPSRPPTISPEQLAGERSSSQVALADTGALTRIRSTFASTPPLATNTSTPPNRLPCTLPSGVTARSIPLPSSPPDNSRPATALTPSEILKIQNRS